MKKETYAAKTKGSSTYEKPVEKKIIVKDKTKARKVNTSKVMGSGLGRIKYPDDRKRAT